MKTISTINEKEDLQFRLFKICLKKDGIEKSYYSITKLPVNMCLNLYFSYSTNKADKNKIYYPLLSSDSTCYLLDRFGTRDEAKQKMKELIKADSTSINVVKEKPIKEKKPKLKKENLKEIKMKKIKEPKIKIPKEPKDPKEYYKNNKEKLKQYYVINKDKIKEYNKKKYIELKQKLKKLQELEN